MNKAALLDQFYTRPVVAKALYKKLNDYYDLDQFFLVEPSAGAGAFSNLFHKNSIAIDIDPKHPTIKQLDFFNFAPSKSRVFTIGNPPFGVKTSLAVKFFNHAATFSQHIAFIVPKSFRKYSVQNRLSLDFFLAKDLDIDANSFTHLGEDYSVPCAFQIWSRGKSRRAPFIPKKESSDFSFCTPNEADFAVRRVGLLAGKVFTEEFGHYSPASHLYVKVKKAARRKEVICRMHDLYKVFQDTAYAAINPSISKGEIIHIYEKAYL